MLLSHGCPRAEQSAHDTIRTEQDRWASIDQLAAEYNTIAAAAQQPRWEQLIRTTNLTRKQTDAVINSGAFGPICAQLCLAEATGHNPARLLTTVIADRDLDKVDDVAAVLHHRLESANQAVGLLAGLDRGDGHIVGHIPCPSGAMPEVMAEALKKRERLMTQRARALAETAIRQQQLWIRTLGSPPADPNRHRVWNRALIASAVRQHREQPQLSTKPPIDPGNGTKHPSRTPQPRSL